MSSRVAFRNFTGGEVTPTLSARYDLQKFGSFLLCCENFIPNLHGDVERRPGTRYLAELGGPAVLVPFRFNTEPENNYALIFGSEIRAVDADGLLSGTGMASPYRLEDVYGLSVAQVGDVVYLAHKKHPLRKLIRSGSAPNYQWTLKTVALNQSLPAPGAPSVAFVRDNPDDDAALNHTLRYVVTAVDAQGMESLPSPVGATTGKYPTDWVVGNHVDITWPAVPGAKEYNIYRETAGYYGLIGVSSSMRDIPGASWVSSLNMNGLTFVPGPRVNATRKMAYDNLNEEWTTKGVQIDANGSQASWYCPSSRQAFVWANSTRYGADYSWVLVNGVVNPALAGSYTSWVTSSALGGSGWGENPAYPSGSYRGYACTPVWSSSASGKAYYFTDQNFEADTSITPKEDWNPFAGGNNPATVAFHQQRMVLGGTRDNPASFYMSRTGDYENFRKSRPLQDDDPVEYMLASGSIDEIRWIASFGELLIGTSGAEYKASSGGAAITPNDVQISVESYWGSSGLQPMIIGNSVMHCQRSGSHVRDLYYSWENDGYAGNDLSLLAPQLVETHNIRQWAFQQSPGSTIWAARDDGVLLCLTYMQEQRVYAWSRHVTDGKVLSVCSLSGDNEDVLLLVVEREIAGAKKYFLERLARRFRDSDSMEEAFFVDCGVTVRNAEPAEEIAGLDHLEGEAVVVLADGSPEEGHVVRGGKIRLRYPARAVHVGLNFRSVLSPLPIETDTQAGSTLGKRRAYGKCVLRLYRSAGGKYAASNAGDLFDAGAWQGRHFYDLPFVPERFGEAVRPFSGDLELSLPSGQDNDTTIWLMQDRPMPFRLAAITADVDFGEA